jgi:hypothetical protein
LGLGRSVFRVPIAAVIALGWLASADAAPIGKAESVIPATTYVRGNAAHGLAINDALEQEDVIQTSSGGSTQIRFIDDTMLTVGPSAEVRLDKGVFDGSQARTLSVKLIFGAMRFVSGVSSRNSYNIQTPVAAIGVRGTVVDLLHIGDRTIVNFVDGSGPICIIATGACHTIAAGEPALAITPTGFSPVTAAEAARLWRRLDAAHLALARQAGRDPSAPSGAATATTAPVTPSSTNNQSSGSTSANSSATSGGDLTYVPPPPYSQIVLTTNPVAPPANPLAYVADPATRVYGAANPAFTGTVSGLQNDDALGNVTAGTLTFTSPATASSNVGTYAINGSGLTVTSPSYGSDILQAPGNATALTITPATLTYAADPATRVYGSANPTFTGTVTGLRNSDLLGNVTTGTATFSSPATAFSNVGTYAINGSGLTVTSANYGTGVIEALGNATALTIIPATLSYTADPVTRIYGAANPTFTGTVGGLQNGDLLGNVATGTASFTSPATASSNVGSYPINGSGLTVTSANYNTGVLEALGNATALTIIPATLTYTADPVSRPFGAVNPTFTGSVTGLQNADALNSVTSGTLAFTSPATSTSAVGQYPIDGSGLTVTSPNYDLIILQAPSNATALTITPGGPAFPSSFTVFRVDGTGNLPIDLSNGQVGDKSGFFYAPASTITYDPGTNDVRSVTVSRTPDLVNDPGAVTLARSAGTGGAQSQVIIGSAVLPGQGATPVPAYFLSTWTNGSLDYSASGVAPGTVQLGANQGFLTIGWGYTGDLFLNPVSFGGRVLFNLENATPAFWSDGHAAPGTFTSGQVAVAIGTTALHYGMIGTVAMPTVGTFNMSTPGGVTNPSQSFAVGAISGEVARIQTTGSVTYSGTANACPNTCYAIMEFNTIAPGKIATIYRLGDGQYFDNGNFPEVEGIATFAQSGTASLTPSAGFVSFIDTFGGTTLASTGPAKGTLQITNGVSALQSVVMDTGPTRTQNGATSTDVGSVPGILGWERWTNGAVTTESGSFNIPTNSGLHFVDGVLATNLPIYTPGYTPSPGTAVQYSLIGGTSPTVTNGSVAPGTLLNTGATLSKVAIDFVDLKIGLDMFVGIGGGTYEIQTTGGVRDSSTSSVSLSGPLFNSGGTTVPVNVLTSSGSIGCTANSNCKATVTGFLAGDGTGNWGGNPNGQPAPYLGLNYSFGDIGGPLSGAVSGAAAFGRDLPVGNVVGYAFSSSTTAALPTGTPTMALGNGPGIVIGDTSTASGLSLGFINVSHNDGTYQDFDRGAFGSPAPGAAVVAEQGAVSGILSWERWTNGTVNDQTSTSYSLTANQGIHVINGVLATDIPTSNVTYTYNFAGGTAPTVADGSVAPGTMQSNSNVGVTFGATPLFGVNLNVSIGGAVYNIQSTGGATAPSLPAADIAATAIFSNSSILTTVTSGTGLTGCATTCNASVNGFLAGKGATNLGILYQFNTANAAKMVSGAAGFTKQ